MITLGTQAPETLGMPIRPNAVFVVLAFFLLTLMLGCGTSDAATQSAPIADAPSGDIQVHGHWTVQVLNPDGTVERVVDFDNDLDPGGGSLLAHLLAGNGSIGGHALKIQLGDSAPDAQCAEADPKPTASINHVPATATIVVGGLMISGTCTIQTAIPNVNTTVVQMVQTRFDSAAGFIVGGALVNDWWYLTVHYGAGAPKGDEMGLGEVSNGQILAFNVNLTFS